MNAAARIFAALVTGALAGLTALVLDEILVRVTLGHFVPFFALLGVSYPALGALFALSAQAIGLLFRWMPSRTSTFAAALAALYALPIFERVHHALAYRMPLAAAVAATLAVLGYAGWITFLRYLAPKRFEAAAIAVGAVGGAVALALNRNVLVRPFALASLAADVAIVLATIGLCAALRHTAGRRGVASLAAAAVIGIAAWAFGQAWTKSRPPGPRPATATPSLILLVVDTLRQDVFQAVIEETPEGQAFRRAMGNAAWFSRAMAAAPWTIPSVGSIMTGLYPTEHGFSSAGLGNPNRLFTQLASSVPTLAEELRQRGYATAAIVANPMLQTVSGIGRGFETYELLAGPTTKLPLGTALWRAGVLRRDYYQQASAVRRRLGERLPRLARSQRPVFLWLHLMDPHDPLYAHQDLAPDPRGDRLPQAERLYRDETRYALRELVRMIEMLRTAELWDDSLVITVSDHGEMFSGDGHDHRVDASIRSQSRHGHSLYGELVRVPLVIRPPGGLPVSRQVDVMTSHVDLFDTIGELLAVDLPRIGRDRISLAPWVDGELGDSPLPPGRQQAVLSGVRLGPPQRALRTPSFKLIDYYGARPSELYDLAADPTEQHDLTSASPEHAPLARDLEAIWAVLDVAPESDAPVLDEETRRRLRALGYVQ